MRKIAVLLFLALMGQVPPVFANPWLEVHRHGFLSTSGRARGSGHELSAYAAYGVTPRLSLGIDIHQSTDEGFRSSHALAFARLPLHQSDQGWQFAGEFMIGTTQSEGQWSAMQRATLSAGRNIPIGERSGWVSFDLSRDWYRGTGSGAWKLDSSLGVHTSGNRLAPLLQVEIYQQDQGELIWKLLPALRYALSDQREVITGLELRSIGATRVGLRLELWQRF